MSAGAGNFLSGFTQGYMGMRRLGMEEERAKQQKDEFEFNKKQRELEAQTREETAQAMSALETQFRAGQQPQSGIKDPNAPEPMTEADYYYERSKVLAKAGVKLGKFSLADEKALQEAGRNVKFEKFRDAVKHAYSNPSDIDGVRKRLNRSGINLPEGIQFQTVPLDPNDPNSDLNLVGFVPGQDGKPQQVFSYLDALPMFAASEVLTADALKTKSQVRGLRADRRNLDLQEGGRNLRADLESKTTLQAARIRADGTSGKQDPEVETFNKLVLTELEGVLKNPQLALHAEEQKVIRAEIGELGRRYLAQKKGEVSAQQAYNQAMQDVFKLYGRPLPKPVQPKK